MIVTQRNILPAATYAATETSRAFSNDGGVGLRLMVNVTAVAGSGVWAVKVQGQDPLSATWFDLTGAVTANITGAGLSTLVIWPDITAAANTKVSDVLPGTWRVVATLVSGTSVTGSISAEVLRD